VEHCTGPRLRQEVRSHPDWSRPMSAEERFDTIVVGGGQAGLTMGY
jgi:hypothetical protein